MKLFKFFIRKAESEVSEINGAIDTWLVSWESVHRYACDTYITRSRSQSFTSKASANSYANELRLSRKLLGDNDLDVTVEKQTPPTNVNKGARWI